MLILIDLNMKIVSTNSGSGHRLDIDLLCELVSPKLNNKKNGIFSEEY